MNSYFQTPPVVKNLIIINALVYMATALIQPAHNAIMEYCALWLGAPLFHTYQFVTYMFVHANFEHIFFNMFALWMFGRTLEYELGSKRFLTYYMVCGIGAALIQYFTALAFGELPLLLVGASGAVMGLLLGQCIGRWGNFINQEAFGTNTNLPWGMYSAKTESYLSGQQAALKAAGVTVDPTMPVHPTFLYESLWCLLGVLVLYWFSKKFQKYNGQVFFLYLIWYGVERFVVEGLRTDSLMAGSFRVSQIVAIVSALAGVVLLIVFRNKGKVEEEYVPVYARPAELEEAEAIEEMEAEAAEAAAEDSEAAKEKALRETSETEAPEAEEMEDAGAGPAEAEPDADENQEEKQEDEEDHGKDH